MISSLLQWFTDPENWAGPDGIPARLWEHLWYTGVTMAVAALIAVPLGLWVGHTGRARWLVSLANSARAVPTLGLLLAASLWLGPKLPGDLAYIVPSIGVLAILAVPPLLAGAYGGIDAVDPEVRDAAYGVGIHGQPGQGGKWGQGSAGGIGSTTAGERSAMVQVRWRSKPGPPVNGRGARYSSHRTRPSSTSIRNLRSTVESCAPPLFTSTNTISVGSWLSSPLKTMKSTGRASA